MAEKGRISKSNQPWKTGGRNGTRRKEINQTQGNRAKHNWKTESFFMKKRKRKAKVELGIRSHGSNLNC